MCLCQTLTSSLQASACSLEHCIHTRDHMHIAWPCMVALLASLLCTRLLVLDACYCRFQLQHSIQVQAWRKQCPLQLVHHTQRSALTSPSRLSDELAALDSPSLTPVAAEPARLMSTPVLLLSPAVTLTAISGSVNAAVSEPFMLSREGRDYSSMAVSAVG